MIKLRSNIDASRLSSKKSWIFVPRETRITRNCIIERILGEREEGVQSALSFNQACLWNKFHWWATRIGRIARRNQYFQADLLRAN